MIWLASFPRSGTTFFRIVLYEAYGIESSTYHTETDYPVDLEYDKYPVVKTHLLPHQLVPDNPDIPAVYLVRDGRDALVSIAHQRTDIIAPSSDFYKNLEEAIIAAEGSHFGGWSQNVLQWLDRASIVIKFEDLIKKPIKCVKRLRPVLDLPRPDKKKLPTFNDLKTKDMQYGSGLEHGFTPEERQLRREKFFRRGKAGSWKDEMPEDLHELFWELHGDVMKMLGYKKFPPLKRFFSLFTEKSPGDLSLRYKKDAVIKKKLLIEASKITLGDNDGCQRYVSELLRGLLPIAEEEHREWEIDVYIGGSIYNILDIRELIMSDSPHTAAEQLFGSQGIKAVALKIRSGLVVVLKKLLPQLLIDFLWGIEQRLHSLLSRSKKTVSYDLLHLTMPNSYKPFVNWRAKLVVTVHDLTNIRCPQYHLEKNINALGEGLEFAVKKKSTFITVSESTKRDLLSEYSVDSNKVHAVLLAADQKKFRKIEDMDYIRQIQKKYKVPDRPYLLSLSTLEPRKNLVNTVRAFIFLLREQPELDVMLVIAGKKGWKYEALFHNQELNSDRILFTGFVEDNDLSALYSGALALSYVCYYEGFGLPPLEAMSCGIPVIYGNNSSMPEVVGDGGLPADPDNIEEIMEKFKLLVINKELRDTLAQNALSNAKRFSWEKSIKDTLEVYRKIMSDSSR